jgi:threonine dehydrogenase-like Zn-dependent dehydrogenase
VLLRQSRSLGAAHALGEFIISHRRPLADAPETYMTFRDKNDGCTKVVLEP